MNTYIWRKKIKNKKTIFLIFRIMEYNNYEDKYVNV